MEVPHQWSHVSSLDNPTDLLFRGLFPSELLVNSLWPNRSWCLHDREDRWPNIQTNVLELRAVRVVCATVVDERSLLRSFSLVSKLKRAVALYLRFVNNIRHKQDGKPLLTGAPTVQELNLNDTKCNTLILEMTQRESFAKEIEQLAAETAIKGILSNLRPFVDSNGLMRVARRLALSDLSYGQRHSIILPRGHHVTQLILRHAHLVRYHVDVLATLSLVRKRYWPINAKRAIGSPIPEHLMGDLPRHHITSNRPFLIAGVNCCGPFFIKERRHRNRAKIKTYVAVFVCFSTRTVHLEMVDDLTIEAFIAFLKRFFAYRGKSLHLYSDNADYFVGADRELRSRWEAMKASTKNDALRQYLYEQCISWHFTPPKSPHFGGLWEAIVKAFKRYFVRVVGETLLTYEALHTNITEIETILNSRPLTPLSSNLDNLSSLTPAHFLIGSSLIDVPETDWEQVHSSRLSIWQHVQKLKQSFWKLWHQEYLHELTVRKKWYPGEASNIEIETLRDSS